MKRSPTLLRLSALVLVLTLTTAPAFAGSRAGLPVKTPSLLSWLSQTLERFIPALAEGRAGLDPNGGPGDEPTTSTPAPEDDSDGRSTIDPDGKGPNG
jgi:hypothetical protein